MKLVGMLDSPYVRRTAIAMQLLGLPFEHLPLSVFRQMPEFSNYNPLLKAPTLLCDDGTVLMDSGLILQYLQQLVPSRPLFSDTASSLLPELRLTALALVVCEKSVQLVYERQLRPESYQYQPWISRISAQLQEALTELEQQLARMTLSLQSADIGLAAVTAAVAWYFTSQQAADVVAINTYPLLRQLSLAAEQLPAFQAAPFGDSVCRGGSSQEQVR